MNSLVTIDSIAIRQDAEGRYCLNDLHRASGGEPRHQPGLWAINQQTRNLIELLKNETLGNPIVALEGRGGGTFVCKELVYAYAMWISPAFNLRVIRSFDAAQSAAVPQTLPEALRLAADMAERNTALERQAALAAPKVAFVDHYVDSTGSKSLRETAKILHMPERLMIDALIRDRALFRQSGNLLPSSVRQREGIFTVKTGAADTGHAFTQTRVTPRGVQWIAERYASELMGDA